MTTDKKPSNGGRNNKGQFAQGNKFSRGKQKGSRHKATIAALELLDGQAELLTQKAVELALNGDTTALRLCLDRIAPPIKESPLPGIELPSVDKASDLPLLTAAILEAVSNGELLPSQAQSLASLVATYGKVLELAEFDARLTKLEELWSVNLNSDKKHSVIF